MSSLNIETRIQETLKALNPLPKKVKTILDKITKFDYRINAIKNEVETFKKTLYAESSHKKDDTKIMESIKKLLKQGEEISDSKVELANSLYDNMDQYIKQFDDYVESFQNELTVENKKSEFQSSINRKKSKKFVKLDIEMKPRGRKMKKKKVSKDSRCVNSLKSLLMRSDKTKNATEVHLDSSPTSSGVSAPISLALALSIDTRGNNIIDMPVDPNEPVYCLCHQVSYGEMVACDNADCPYEWFHFGCVGLVDNPSGKWYCPPCTELRKKQALLTTSE